MSGFASNNARRARRISPQRVARRLDRVLRRFAGALETDASEQDGHDLFAQARQLEEMVAWLVAMRRTHEETLRLQRNLTRLMHEVFRTPEWRRSQIQGM